MKSTSLTQERESIGRLLAETIRKNSSDQPGCPRIEDITSFAEGTLDDGKVDSMINHLKKCWDCRKLFSDISETNRLFKTQHNKLYKQQWLRAAAVIFVVGILGIFAGRYVINREQATGNREQITVRQEKNNLQTYDVKKKQTPLVIPKAIARTSLTSFQLTKVLASSGHTSELLPFLTSQERRAYGFSGTLLTQEKFQFKIGLLSTGVEIAFMANDRDQALLMLSALAEEMKTSSRFERKTAVVLRIMSRIGEGAPPVKFSGDTEKLLFTEIDKSSLVPFGAWVEAARVACQVQQKNILKPEYVKYFLKTVNLEAIQKGVYNPLEVISDIVSKDVLTVTDYNNIDRQLETIINLLM